MAIRDLPKTPMEQIQGLLGPYISAIPVLGTVDAITRAGRAAMSGNGAGAAEALADVIPVGRGVSRAVKAITKGKSAGDVGGLLNIRAPQQDALDLAQKRAALPVSEGGLGLPPDNTPKQRADILFPKKGFHATGADIRNIDPAKVAESDYGTIGQGFYIDPSPTAGYSNLVARINQEKSPQNIMPVRYRDDNLFDMTDMLGPKSPEASRALTQRMRDMGYQGTISSVEGKPNELAVFDPSIVRSEFAAFDPFRRNEADLLAIQGGSRTSGLDSSNLNRYETEADRRMEIARRNAALPVEQGGLGLPENNTPMDRAKAMGYDIDNPLYHGTDQDIQRFLANRAIQKDAGWYGEGVYTTPDTDAASAYANWRKSQGMDVDGQNVMPLLARKGKVFDYGDGQPITNPAEARAFSETVRGLGYNTVEVPNKYADPRFAKNYETVLLDPSQIRSRFAAFDPMRRNEADLLAFRGNIGTSNLLNINPLLGLLENP